MHASIPYPLFVNMLSDVLLSEPDLISPDALLVEELGLQSLDVVYLAEQLEAETGQSLGSFDLSAVETVEELYWELVTGDAAALPPPPHAQALRRWLPDDPLSDVQTLVGMIARRSAVTPDRVAVRFEESAVTFRQLADTAAHLAGALQSHGVCAGDRVILVMPNGLAFFGAFYGIQQLGGVSVPLFHAPQPARIARIARHCGARAVVTHRPLAGPVRAELERLLGPDGPALLDTSALLAAPARAGAPPAQPEPDALAMLQYTSGTTGAPKGVMLTHRALLANIRQAIPCGAFTHDDVFVSWLPVYHDMGLITMTMCPLYLGAELVLLPVRLSADAWLSAVAAHRGTVTAAPDFAYRYVLRSGGDLSRYDVGSLRMALVAAEPVRAQTIARFEAALGLSGVLRPGYGLAEASVAVAFYPLDRPALKVDDDGMVCVGLPMPGLTLSIRDPDGAPVATGERGEVCFRSPSQARGYFNNPAATAALLTADGHVRTGDIGYLDAEGMLTIVDRIKSIIIVGGRNLSPRELEEASDAVEGVILSMAVGLDRGGDAGEQVQLVVETRQRAPDATQQRALARAIRASVQQRVGVRVQRVFVVPRGTIPRTYNGKLQHPVMRARLRQTGSPLPQATVSD